MAFIVKKEIISAPTTLPLSTPVIYINGDLFNRVNDTTWYGSVAPYGYYSYTFLYYVNWQLLWYDNNDQLIILSSNNASSSSIPLIGWTPSITITTP